MLEKVIYKFGLEENVNVEKLESYLNKNPSDYFNEPGITNLELIILIAVFKGDNSSYLESPEFKCRLTGILDSDKSMINLAHCAALAGNHLLLEVIHQTRPELINQVSSNGQTTAYYAAVIDDINVLSFIKKNYQSLYKSDDILYWCLQANSLNTFNNCLENTEEEGLLTKLGFMIARNLDKSDNMVKLIDTIFSAALIDSLSPKFKIPFLFTLIRTIWNYEIQCMINYEWHCYEDSNQKKLNELTAEIKDNNTLSLILNGISTLEPVYQQAILMPQEDRSIVDNVLYRLPDKVPMLLDIISTWDESDKMSILQNTNKSGDPFLIQAIYNPKIDTSLVFAVINQLSPENKSIILQVKSRNQNSPLAAAFESEDTDSVLSILEIIKILDYESQVKLLMDKNRDGTDALKLAIYYCNANEDKEKASKNLSVLIEIINALELKDKAKILQSKTNYGDNALDKALMHPQSLSSLLPILAELEEDDKVTILTSKDYDSILGYTTNYLEYFSVSVLISTMKRASESDFLKLLEIVKKLSTDNQIALFSLDSRLGYANVLDYAIQNKLPNTLTLINLIGELGDPVKKAILWTSKPVEQNFIYLALCFCNQEEFISLIKIIDTLPDIYKKFFFRRRQLYVNWRNFSLESINREIKPLEDIPEENMLYLSKKDFIIIEKESKYYSFPFSILSNAMVMSKFDVAVAISLINMILEIDQRMVDAKKPRLAFMVLNNSQNLLSMAVYRNDTQLINLLLVLIGRTENRPDYDTMLRNALALAKEKESNEIVEQINSYIAEQKAKAHLAPIQENRIYIETIQKCYRLCAREGSQAGPYGYLTRLKKSIPTLSLELILRLFYDKKSDELQIKSTTLQTIFKELFKQFPRSDQTSSNRLSLFQPPSKNQQTHEYIYQLAVENKKLPPGELAKLLITEYEKSLFGPPKTSLLVSKDNNTQDNDVVADIHCDF